jgi:hypothetical protein
LRWKFAAGRPGVKTGIPAGDPAQGEGVRVRYIDDSGYPRLYFDQESTASSGFIGTGVPTRDLDDVRAFWADPAAPRPG